MKIGFTGHRPNKLGGYQDCPTHKLVKSAIRDILGKLLNDLEHVNTGMALGVDTWVAQLCEELGIAYWAYVPCPEQASKWRPEQRAEYERLLSAAEQVIEVCPAYTWDCMQRRNVVMTNQSDGIVAIWDGTQGGTANCANYALDCNKLWCVVNPRLLPSTEAITYKRL